MIFIGVDPSSAKETAIVLEYAGEYHFLLVDPYCWHTTIDNINALNLPLDETVTATIEGQEIYRGSKVNANDILELANRSGFFEGLIRSIWRDVDVLRPTPKTWKGQVKASVMVNRCLKIPLLKSIQKDYSDQHFEDVCHAYKLLEWGKARQL